MRYLFISGLLAAGAMVLSVSGVLAGGFAVTTLDSLPSNLRAGQTYRIGYIIRQHGVTPFTQATPRIRISHGSEHLAFDGSAEGAAGHYVSEVSFPTEGDWTWSVDQTPFAPQALGTISVQPASPMAVVVVGVKPRPPFELAMAGVVGLFLVGVVVTMGRMRWGTRLERAASKPTGG